MVSALPTINMFWDGARLGPVHAGCVRSFLRHGHRVVMHCYAPPSDLPEGVELFDATRLMPRSDLIVSHARNSVALGANRYRYRLIQAGMGIYADCDMYCLRPIEAEPYMLGWEDNGRINNAFLNYPADSALARMLVAATQSEYYIPEWVGRRGKLRLRIRRAVGRSVSVSDMPWGVWGPRLLTHCVNKLGLREKISPIDYFYPLHWSCTALLFESGLKIEDLATPRTRALHLVHTAQDKRPVPPGSPLQQIIDTP